MEGEAATAGGVGKRVPHQTGAGTSEQTMSHDEAAAAGLPPVARLLWGDRERPPRGRPPKLSLERIVTAAVAVADAEGLQALSMQRLATELGAATMSLYRYVSGKDELIALMLDTVIGPPGDVAAAGTWRAGLLLWARQNLEIFRRHPWTLPLVTTRRIMGPNETAHLEAALGAISGLGLSASEMLDIVLLVNGFVRGTAQHSVPRGPGDDPVAPDDASTPAGRAPGPETLDTAALDRLGLRDRYPTLARVMASVEDERDPAHPVAAGFDFGLRCILDGIDLRLLRGGADHGRGR